MNNDELKKKIVDIIQSVKLCTNQANCDICKYDKEIESYTDMSCTTLRIADALIAAGIGDVKEAKKEVEYWENEAKTARADIDDAVKEITEIIFTELRDYFVEQSAYAADCNQHTGYYDYEIKVSDVVCDIVAIAEKYGVELGAKDDD